MKEKLYVLTEAQKRVLTTHKMNTEGAICNIGGRARIKGKVNIEALKTALKSLVDLNDSFHIRIVYKEDFYQYFDKGNKVDIDYKDFSCCNNPIDAFQEWEEKEIRSSFLLEESPLYYMCIFKLSENEYGYYVKFHHIIADGWSIQLLTERVRDTYIKILKEETPDTKIYSFKEYVEQNANYYQSDAYKRDKDYWNTIFSDIPERLMIPIDHFEHTSGRRISFILDEEEEYYLRDFCKKANVTLHTTMVLLIAIYFMKVNGISDIVIGSPTLGRCNRRERNIIGMFVSSLPIRCQVQRTDNLVIVAKKISKRIKESFKHQMYPLNHLTKDIELNSTEGYKLFDICVNYYNTYLVDRFNDMEVEYYESYNGHQDYSLQMIVREWSNDQKIQLDFDYKISKFKEEEIDAIYLGLKVLIKMLYKPDEHCLKDICLLNQYEYQKLVIDYNRTGRKWDTAQSLWDLFKKQALKLQDKVALSCGDVQLTYGELYKCVIGIAQNLSRNFLGNSNIIIGIYMTHSIEAVAVFLSAAKANFTFVPLDIDSPMDRINRILESTCIDLIITNKRNVEWGNYKGKIWIVDDIHYYIQNENLDMSLKRVNKHIYTIFTSGSTGNPKGVLVKEDSLINYLNWAKEYYNVNESDRFALFTPFAFDLTVTSIFLPLIAGASIRVYQPDNGLALETIVNEDTCTMIKLTPSHLTILEHCAIEQTKIQTIIVGGENLKVSVIEAIRKKKENISFFNEYGPTECTIGCMGYLYNRLTSESSFSVPIGKPIANVQIYLLDYDYQPVPKFTVGEIYIGGDCLATGYVNERELTLEKFCSIPTIDGKLVYKTGDLAKFIDDNTLVFCGRNDNQLKIRGHRIEIGEIEHYLSKYNIFKDFALKLHNWGKSNLLCLYYTANQPVEERKIISYLKNYLPSYMIPSYSIYLSEMPLTQNGKVDIKRLPLPQMEEVDRKSNVKNMAEKTLVQCAEDVFGHNMDIRDNFYEAGGDSIKAIQLSYKLREKGYLLKINHIFEKPCLMDMALLLAEQDEAKNAKENLNGKLELTPILTWFFTQNLEETPYYQVVELQLRCEITITKLQKIITQLFLNHDIFRIIYKNYCLCYVDKEVPIINEEWIKNDSSVSVIVEKEKLGRGLDITKGKVFDSKLLHKNSGDILIIAIHHLCIDGISWRILLNELDSQLSMKENIKVKEKADSFMHFASSLKNRQSSIKVPDEHELQQISEQNISYAYQTYFPQEEINEMYKKANKAYNTEAFELLLASIVKTLKEEFDKQYRIIELESHGRFDNECCDILHTVGWFTVLYPYYADFDFSNLQDLLTKTKEQYRRQKGQLNTYALSHDYCKLKKRPFLRFNYIGEVETQYDGFVLTPNVLYEGKCTNPLEVDCYKVDEGLMVVAKGDAKFLKENKISDFVNRFHSNLLLLIELCLNSPKQFTPSDFETVDLTCEDIQILFD